MNPSLLAPGLWPWLLAVWLLGGCASQPLVYPDVAPPEPIPTPLLRDGRPLIGLALGGGAARGFAHIGVIKVLEEHGIRPDIVVGTSAGSFVGALYAGGYSGVTLEHLAAELREEEVRDWALPDRGFVKGERLQDFVNIKLHNRSIEELPVHFAAVATDLANGAPTVFTYGNVGMAVRASSAIPGVVQPVPILGREYVDGGLVSPVPVRVARELGADLVIAVDIAKRPEHSTDILSTADVVGQSLGIMMKQLATREGAQADIMIRPDTRELSSIDFTTRLDAIQEGMDAARQVIDKVLEWLARLPDGGAGARAASRLPPAAGG